MGIEYHLGRNDHRVAEDFLTDADYRVFDAIRVDGHNTQRQQGVIEAANGLGVPVLVELLLDRLENPGFDYGPLPYLPDGGVSGSILASDAFARRELVERCIEFQRDIGAEVVAPHLFQGDPLHDDLALEFIHETVRQTPGDSVRVVVAANRDRLAADDYRLARSYSEQLATLGVSTVELRLSPTGDRDMSVSKVSSVLEVANIFGQDHEDLILGYQGIIGPASIALVAARGFSVGIGLRERYDYASLRRPQMSKAEDDHAYGPQAGVYLPTAGTTVSRRMAAALYEDPNIRSRLRCRYPCCEGRIDGPAQDPRKHYLYSRLAQISELIDRPYAWRVQMEKRRIEESISTVEIINDGHVPEKCHPIKARTLKSLASILDQEAEQRGQRTA